MQVSVSAELQKFIDEEIAQGRYASPSELIERAIEALREQDAADERRLADLRAQIAIARAEAEAGDVLEYADAAELSADIRSLRSSAR